MASSSDSQLVVGVVGLGHVGLPTSLGFCEAGWDVIGYEHDPGRRAEIAAGDSPYYEPGLDQLLSKHLDSSALQISESLA